MAMIRPFGEMQNQMERMFSDMFSMLGPTEEFYRPFAPGASAQQRGWVPAVEISETDDEYCIRAEVPGIQPENVDVEVAGNAVTISGRTQQEQEQQQGRLHRSELRYGQFMRRLVLPNDVQSEQASASFRNGILELHLPKAEESRRRRIKVSAEGGASQQLSGGQQQQQAGGQQRPGQTQR
jgi:HSP20 family protein